MPRRTFLILLNYPIIHSTGLLVKISKYLQLLVYEFWKAISVDLDEMPHSVATHLALHSLPKTHGKGTIHKITDLKK